MEQQYECGCQYSFAGLHESDQDRLSLYLNIREQNKESPKSNINLCADCLNLILHYFA